MTTEIRRWLGVCVAIWALCLVVGFFGMKTLNSTLARIEKIVEKSAVSTPEEEEAEAKKKAEAEAATEKKRKEEEAKLTNQLIDTKVEGYDRLEAKVKRLSEDLAGLQRIGVEMESEQARRVMAERQLCDEELRVIAAEIESLVSAGGTPTERAAEIVNLHRKLREWSKPRTDDLILESPAEPRADDLRMFPKPEDKR